MEPFPTPPPLPPMPLAPPLPLARRSSAAMLTNLSAVAIGATLFAGLAAYHAIYLVPGSGSPSSPYQDTVRLLFGVSTILLDLAVALSVTVAFLVSGSRDDLSDSARRGPMLFAVVLTAVWFVLTGIGLFRYPFVGF